MVTWDICSMVSSHFSPPPEKKRKARGYLVLSRPESGACLDKTRCALK